MERLTGSFRTLSRTSSLSICGDVERMKVVEVLVLLV